MKKIAGYITAIIGFIMILYSALNYVLGWNIQANVFGAIGIICLAIGMGIVKKSG
jgi:hypothetical protein